MSHTSKHPKYNMHMVCAITNAFQKAFFAAPGEIGTYFISNHFLWCLEAANLEIRRKDKPVLVKFKKLVPEAIIPTRGSDQAAGLDLYYLGADKEVTPGDAVLLSTGIAMSIPSGYEGQIRPRSGLALKHGVTVLNAPGTVDSDYRGEVKVMLINHGFMPMTVHTGDRIAQLVVQKVEMPMVQEVEELDSTDRGTGGFGSTGK